MQLAKNSCKCSSSARSHYFGRDCPQQCRFVRPIHPGQHQPGIDVCSASAQRSAEAAFILDGQGHKVPFPAVDWHTNAKTYAAFAKSSKAAPAPFKLTMGLESLHKDDWIEVTSQYIATCIGAVCETHHWVILHVSAFLENCPTVLAAAKASPKNPSFCFCTSDKFFGQPVLHLHL